MTEKRFNLAFYDEYDGTFSIQDKLYLDENKHLHSLDEIIDLLNDLNNKNLDLLEDLDYYKKRIKELEIENQGQSDAIDGLQGMIVHFDLEEIIK